MKFIKRFMAVILTISLFAVSVAGCASSKEQASDMLTREEWIAMLTEAYHMDECYNTTPVFADVSTQSEYFVQIQSCAEWEIVDKTSRFYPELTATNLFAIVTAVRAVGLDKVEKTKDAPSLESAEKIADYFLQQTNMKLDMSDDLTAKTAQQILDASLELAAGLVLEQYHDLQYQDGVLEISENDIAIDYEKQTAELHGIQAEAGTVIVVSPSATLPDGLMAKVTSVDGTRISFENAEMEEVIDSLLLYGTYAPEILRVTPLTDGVTAEYGEEASASAAETLSAYTVPKTQTLGLSGSAPSVQSMLKKEIEVEDAVLKLDKKLEENGAQVRINGSVGIKDILVTAELDCSLMKFNKASLQVDSTIAADISVSAKLDRTFKLAKIECRLWKVVGVDFIVSLHIDLNGNISVEFSVENCEGVSYKPDAKPKCFAKFQKPELEAQVQVQASAEPSITVELVIGPWSVTNIGAEVDLNAEAKVLSTEDGLICTDVKMYVLVSAFVGREAQNGDETLLAKFGVQKNWDIWTKDNTKMKKAWHVENGQVVPACTRGTGLFAQQETENPEKIVEAQIELQKRQWNMNFGSNFDYSDKYFVYKNSDFQDNDIYDQIICRDSSGEETIIAEARMIGSLGIYANRVYYNDIYKNSIECCNMDGSSTTTFYTCGRAIQSVEEAKTINYQTGWFVFSENKMILSVCGLSYGVQEIIIIDLLNGQSRKVDGCGEWMDETDSYTYNNSLYFKLGRTITGEKDKTGKIEKLVKVNLETLNREVMDYDMTDKRIISLFGNELYLYKEVIDNKEAVSNDDPTTVTIYKLNLDTLDEQKWSFKSTTLMSNLMIFENNTFEIFATCAALSIASLDNSEFNNVYFDDLGFYKNQIICDKWEDDGNYVVNYEPIYTFD